MTSRLALHHRNGNLTGKNPTARPGGQAMAYDAWNRLVLYKSTTVHETIDYVWSIAYIDAMVAI